MCVLGLLDGVLDGRLTSFYLWEDLTGFDTKVSSELGESKDTM